MTAVWSFLCLGLHFGICTTSSLIWRILLEVDRVPEIKRTRLGYELDNQGFHTWQGLGIFCKKSSPPSLLFIVYIHTQQVEFFTTILGLIF